MGSDVPFARVQAPALPAVTRLLLWSCRLLELESSGQRSELRLHYQSRGQQPHTEVFPYSLADQQWHRLALAVSASHLLLHVDCNR